MSDATAKRIRIVMSDRDKHDIKQNLVWNFMRLGFDKESVERAVTAGSVPMFMWMSKWICHETDYPETRQMTDEKFMQSLYAWIHYKATAEKIGKPNNGIYPTIAEMRKELKDEARTS